MSSKVDNSFYGLLLEFFGTLFLVFTVLVGTIVRDNSGYLVTVKHHFISRAMKSARLHVV